MSLTRPRPLIAGNWKMNGLQASRSVLDEITAGYNAIKDQVDCVICPPATLLMDFVARARNSGVKIGAQDCHQEVKGAFTGDISAQMLRDAGADYVIVGHSERRNLHHETNADIAAKVQAAVKAGLIAILCVGETREEREAGQALTVVSQQLRGSVPHNFGPEHLIIAYEPVWAIGTGLTPTPTDIAEIHALMRHEMKTLVTDDAAQVRLLYGGSVKPQNAAELLNIDNVNGALVGGASLIAEDFLAIAEACKA
jgi:triosephosphate isomerase (TIM)